MTTVHRLTSDEVKAMIADAMQEKIGTKVSPSQVSLEAKQPSNSYGNLQNVYGGGQSIYYIEAEISIEDTTRKTE